MVIISVRGGCLSQEWGGFEVMARGRIRIRSDVSVGCALGLGQWKG